MGGGGYYFGKKRLKEQMVRYKMWIVMRFMWLFHVIAHARHNVKACESQKKSLSFLAKKSHLKLITYIYFVMFIHRFYQWLKKGQKYRYFFTDKMRRFSWVCIVWYVLGIVPRDNRVMFTDYIFDFAMNDF